MLRFVTKWLGIIALVYVLVAGGFLFAGSHPQIMFDALGINTIVPTHDVLLENIFLAVCVGLALLGFNTWLQFRVTQEDLQKIRAKEQRQQDGLVKNMAEVMKAAVVEELNDSSFTIESTGKFGRIMDSVTSQTERLEGEARMMARQYTELFNRVQSIKISDETVVSIATLSEQIQALSDTLEGKDGGILEAKAELQALEQQVAELTTALSKVPELTAQMSTLKHAVAAQESGYSGAADTLQNLDHLHRRVKALQQVSNRISDPFDDGEGDIEDALHTLEADLERLETFDQAALERQFEQVSLLRTQKEAAYRDVNTFIQQLKKLSGSIDDLKVHNDSMKDPIGHGCNLRDTLAVLERDLNQLSSFTPDKAADKMSDIIRQVGKIYDEFDRAISQMKTARAGLLPAAAASTSE